MTDQPQDPAETTIPAQTPVITPPTTPLAPIARQPGANADPASGAPVMWSAHEAVSNPVISPVVPVSAARRSSGKFRWAIALVVVALVAGTASAAFFALAGSASSSSVARWAPAGSLLYSETRFDLPGDQHAALGTFLSSFPGFADQSTLDTKLDEIYDRVVKGATNGSQDYSTKIKPWFGGQTAFVLPTLPKISGADSTDSVRAALIVSVTDATKASEWLATLPPVNGTTTATYAGVSLSVVTESGQQYAWGVDGTILVAGDVQSVHDVIDTKGSTGLAESAGFKQALGAYKGDHLGFVYADLKGLIAAAQKANPDALGTMQASVLAKLPAWFATTVRADGNNLIFDVAAPTPAGSPAIKDHTSTIATHLPSSTIAELEVHDLGTIVTNAIKSYSDMPEYKTQLDQLTSALDKVGGLDSFTSWLGDAAIAVTKDGASYGGGFVIALPDDKSTDTAKGKLASLKNLASLAGGGKVTVTDATYNGATITTIDFGDLSTLAPGTTLPSGFGDGRAAVSFTLNNGLVIFGVGGDGFVKAVLDTKSGSALADQARYKAAIDAAGGANVEQGYVDLRAVIDAVVAQIPADQRAKYDSDVQPYLAGLQSISIAAHGGDIEHSVSVLTVGK